MRRATVLLVDDDESALLGLGHALRGLDLKVLFADGADMALALLGQERVDVVVTDDLMPGGDGLTLLREVVDAFPDTERILVSGHADLGVAAEAINAGLIFRLLQKPFDREALRGALLEAVEHLAVERESRRLLAEVSHRRAAPGPWRDPFVPVATPETAGWTFEDWPDEPLALPRR